MSNVDQVPVRRDEIRIEKYFSSNDRVFVVWLNGQKFERRKPKSGDRPASWLGVDPDGGDGHISAETKARLKQIFRNRKSYDRVLRFPRLKLQKQAAFDVDNPTWENIPRFDPEEVDDTKWVIQSFIPENGIHLVYGAEGSCKTTLMLYAGKCVAEGKVFFGMKTIRRRFLVFDYENPGDFVRSRAIDLNLDLPRNPHLAIWNRFNEPIPHPSDPWLKKFVRSHVKKYGVGPILIFDSWSSLLKPGEGGETTGQIAPIYAHFRTLADLGATIIVIDHTRREKTAGLYGGADKFAKSDSSHWVIGPDRNGVVKVKSTLKRYSPESSDQFSFKVCGSKDDDGNWHITGLQSMPDAEKEEKIRKIEYVGRLIKEKGQDGKEVLLNKAVEEGHSRTEINKILESEKRYWEMHKGKAGKHVYRLLEGVDPQNPAPKGAGVPRN